MTDSPQRFLIVRLSSIGDIVHTLPAVVALGETFPRAELDWVVERCHASLLRDNPYLHRLVELDTRGWRRRMRARTAFQEVRRGWRELRESRYDAALDFQGLWKSAVVTWCSGASERIGLIGPRMREASAAVLYTQRVSPREGAHVVEESLALVERLGAHTEQWQFPLPRAEADDAYVQSKLAALHAQDFIIINPGAGWRSKCWSPANYADLIRRLERTLPKQILLTGSPQEEEVISDILKEAGATGARYLPATILQFIALARRARLFVGGDTGPLHLAAAVGTPIVGIYGPTDPARNGPFAPDDIALWNGGPINHTRRSASPAYLPGVSVESVLEAIGKRLARAYG